MAASTNFLSFFLINQGHLSSAVHLEMLSQLNLNAKIRAYDKTLTPMARISTNTETLGLGEKSSTNLEEASCKRPEILSLFFFFLKMDTGGENHSW